MYVAKVQTHVVREGMSRCLGELFDGGAVPCGRTDRRSKRAMLSRSSSRMSTNCRAWTFATSFARTGGDALDRMNSCGCAALVLLGVEEALGMRLCTAGTLWRAGARAGAGLKVAICASGSAGVPVV